MPNIKLEQDENPTMYPEFSQPRQSAYHTIPGMLDAPPVPPTQSEPTQVLYERARTAAQAKGPPNGRKSTVPSQRRPWSEEEERALMDGVDRVKGPHWSQILALYGAGGSISEVLKDRNQVQLKDKARNLKLFFLKSKLEVPYYLQGVTGDLRTRAPNVLAREEAQRQLQESKLREDQSGHSVDGSGTLSPPNHHGHTVERVPTANMNPAQYSQIAPQPTGDVRQAVKQAFLHAHHHQHGENSPYDYDRISGQHPRP
ncbi:hypothetical protein M501DRAFT_998466 [Patellaria atrata CBS 101060]|uniref:HTH myb-type domain-containing protein n=1 Tax=Patellaria atrata CBS 101060 TaxID=1346257 RepID=A0A9P4SIH8_9PEZI|nr:hypothetical protein M501DRAFT_998466 [Patellaria atrata CBS 101060]